jgi:competence protein ComEC
MDRFKINLKWYILGTLAVMTYFIWSLVLADVDRELKIAFLDIGQGDAIYIEAPNGRDMIIDGGPPGALLPVLSSVMPFSDHSIDVIVVTNPDQDHFAGFVDLLDSYEVGAVVEPGTYNKSKIYARLEGLIEEKKIPKLIARKGMKIDLGGGVHFDVLFPDRDVSTWKVNDGSIVGRLVYGNTSVMLTGDAPQKTESYILGNELKSDILKVGHHGSRTSTSESFVKEVDPQYAVISDGKDNTYGHPHQETLDTLEKIGAIILRTDLFGTIIFESDGIRLLRLF